MPAIKTLLCGPESPTLAFQREAAWTADGLVEARKADLLRDILAMANSPTGETGRLVMGVARQHDGSALAVADIARVDEAALLRFLAQAGLDGRVDCSLQHEKVDGYLLALIEVKPAARVPVRVPGQAGIWVRRGTENMVETPERYQELASLRLARQAEAPPEAAPAHDPGESAETAALAGRIHEVLRAHGMLPIHLPRLYPRFKYGILNSPGALAAALTDRWMQGFCDLFWLNRAWLDGAGGPAHRTLCLGVGDHSILHHLIVQKKAGREPSLHLLTDRPGQPQPGAEGRCAVVVASTVFAWEYSRAHCHQPLYKVLDLGPGDDFGRHTLLFLLMAAEKLDIPVCGNSLPDAAALAEVAAGAEFIGPFLARANPRWATPAWKSQDILKRRREWGAEAMNGERVNKEIESARRILDGINEQLGGPDIRKSGFFNPAAAR